MTWEEVIEQAKQVAKEYNIPVSVMLAQAEHESARGTAIPGNNYFGIKGSGTGGTQRLMTWEDYGKGPVRVSANFAVFATPADAFRAYAKLITESGIYNRALPFRNDPERFLQEIKNSGYATDPNYFSKVSKYEKQYRPLNEEMKREESNPVSNTEKSLLPQWWTDFTKKLKPEKIQAAEPKLDTISQITQDYMNNFKRYKPGEIGSTKVGMDTTMNRQGVQENALYPSVSKRLTQNYTAPTVTSQYTVKGGDTLWQIAQDYLGSGSLWPTLGYTGNPRTLQIGTKINIPQQELPKGVFGGPSSPQPNFSPSPVAVSSATQQQYKPPIISSGFSTGYTGGGWAGGGGSSW